MSRTLPATALTGLAVLGGAALLLVSAQVAAYHCDETNVFRAMTQFALGNVGSPGRPGLLWLLLAPITWLGDPARIALTTRVVVALVSTGTLLSVAAMLRRSRADSEPDEAAWAGALGVLVLASSMQWQTHAFEIRTDSFIVPLTLGAMALLWRRETGPRRAAMAGVLIAASGLISQKSVYNAVAIGLGWAVFCLVADRPLRLRVRLREAAIVAGVVVGAFAVWFVTIGLVSGRGVSVASQIVEVGVRTAFTQAHPSWDQKVGQLSSAFDKSRVLWGLYCPAVIATLLLARRRPHLATAAVASLVMLSTITFHRGFRTYFVASFEPWMALVVGGALGALVGRIRRGRIAVGLALALGILGVQVHWGRAHLDRVWGTSNAEQLRVLRDVGEAFPEPVPYIDMLALVPGYPEIFYLGTAPQRELYRKLHGSSAFKTRAIEAQAKLFVRTFMSRDTYFKPSERLWWWSHFVPWRPNISLAGLRTVVAPGRPADRRLDLVNDGDYTVWFRGGWRGTASVDGQPVSHGQVIALQSGDVRLQAESTAGEGELQLLLGAGRVPYAETAEQQQDFSMFPRDGRDRLQHYDARGRDADMLTSRSDPSLTEREYVQRAHRHKAWQAKMHQRDAR